MTHQVKRISPEQAWQEGFEAALRWARDTSQRAESNPYWADQPVATETAPLCMSPGCNNRALQQSSGPEGNKYYTGCTRHYALLGVGEIAENQPAATETAPGRCSYFPNGETPCGKRGTHKSRTTGRVFCSYHAVEPDDVPVAESTARGTPAPFKMPRNECDCEACPSCRPNP